ncbi:MAG: glycosyltransferase family 1 protein [Alphaproteobacteria bacterium]|nr:glycosyltransferase family 1 protein [Alphaproteobacteria bacterium]
MRILIVNTDYPAFLDQFYLGRPEMKASSYVTQMRARNDSLFGTADFYSRAFTSIGCQACEVHANNDPMQMAWAREHSQHLAGRSLIPPFLKNFAERARRRIFGRQLDGTLLNILSAQIRHYEPDVVLNHDMYLIPGLKLRQAAGSRALIVGQIASPVPSHIKLSDYDLLLSSLPNLVAGFRAAGIPAELCRLAFDSQAQKAASAQQMRYGVVFVGSLSSNHGRRFQLLETLAASCPQFELWGPRINHVVESSPLHAAYKGEAWGADMYSLLGRAAITVNIHIDMAQDHANNCRLYEATGMGSLLLTDDQRDLSDIFIPGAEVVTFSSPSECLTRVQELLQDEKLRQRIAKAGQEKTLATHTYVNRASEMLEIFTRHGAGIS